MQIDGIEVIIQPSSFRNATALKMAVANAIRKEGIDIDLDSFELNEKDVTKSKIGSSTVGSLLGNILSLATDPGLEKALFKCCEKVVLFGDDKEPVNETFFEDHERWGFYYPIMIEVLKVNLVPFFGKISSLFEGVEGLIGRLQKST